MKQLHKEYLKACFILMVDDCRFPFVLRVGKRWMWFSGATSLLFIVPLNFSIQDILASVWTVLAKYSKFHSGDHYDIYPLRWCSIQCLYFFFSEKKNREIKQRVKLQTHSYLCVNILLISNLASGAKGLVGSGGRRRPKRRNLVDIVCYSFKTTIHASETWAAFHFRSGEAVFDNNPHSITCITKSQSTFSPPCSSELFPPSWPWFTLQR